MIKHDLTRREFIRRSSALGVLGSAMPWALNLAAIGEASAATGGDYKALVCVFLDGGNDHGNTVIPYDQVSYDRYAGIRQALARPRDSLLPLTPGVALPDARQLALAPELAPLKPLFDSGDLGVLLNVGSLIVPTSKSQYTAQSVPLPAKLFSHIDQQGSWQASSPEGRSSGWGGRMADLMLSGNGGSAFTGVSVSGNAVYLAGKTASQFQVAPGGPVPLWATRVPLYGSQACSDALAGLVAGNYAHVLENAHSTVMRRGISSNTLLEHALQSASVATSFPEESPLAAQLKMVARMIAARDILGMKRQVFYVSLGGFDQHAYLASKHPELLAQLADALSAFHAATAELGVSSQVTTFTASDFGRTLTVNGNGSDHGWGGHHFVMGGSVQGGRFWGQLPEVSVNGPDDVGQGRLLPTTSVDQLAAELATWMGIGSGDMTTVLPYSGNFDLGHLGLFA